LWPPGLALADRGFRARTDNCFAKRAACRFAVDQSENAHEYVREKTSSQRASNPVLITYLADLSVQEVNLEQIF
jgi:hypothetical protein